MNFSDELKKAIKPWHLLSHPFYQEWTQGSLSPEILKTYASEYYTHVKAFPRYISATHSQCENLGDRKILLENLMDEEGYKGTDHPQLWAQFAYGVGVTAQDLNSYKNNKAIKDVVETFMSAAQSSYCEGLASLYAYEYQVPEVAETKIEGLKEHYGITEKECLEFFQVHMEADEIHRQACEHLLNNLSEPEQKRAIDAAKKSAQSLWSFLTSMHEKAYAA